VRPGHLEFRGLGLGLSCFERGMFEAGPSGLCFLDSVGWNWGRPDVVPTDQLVIVVTSNHIPLRTAANEKRVNVMS
jgi:hypothetical protein